MTAASAWRSITLELSAEQAVALYELVATSSAFNGLGPAYVALGDLVRDENGLVPGYDDYKGPAWA